MGGFLFERLALAGFDFVSAQAFLCFGISRMFASDWIVLFQANFFGRILRIFCGVVRTVATEVTYQTNQLSLRILLCHYSLFYRYYCNLINSSIKTGL